MSLRKSVGLKVFIHTSHHILRPQSMTDAEWAAPRQNECSGGVSFFRKTYSMETFWRYVVFGTTGEFHSPAAEANMRRVLGPHLDAMNSEVWFFFPTWSGMGDFSVWSCDLQSIYCLPNLPQTSIFDARSSSRGVGHLRKLNELPGWSSGWTKEMLKQNSWD